MMRILFFPEQLTIGGAEYYFIRKARWFKERGHHVWVASAGGPLEKELARAGIPHLTLPSVSQFTASLNLKDVVADSGRLNQLLLEEQIEIVDTVSVKPFIYAYTLCKNLGIPVFLEALSSIYFLPSGYRESVLEVAQNGRLYAMGEDEAAACAHQVGIDPSLIRVMPLGIDVEVFKPKPSPLLRRELGIDPEATIVVTTARLDADKETYISHLLSDFSVLQRFHPTLHLVIVGDGSRRESLEARVRALGIRNVWWLGARMDTDLIYPGADIFVGMGTAALEAAACGLPVIIVSVRNCRPPFAPRESAAICYFGDHEKRSIGHDIPGLPPRSIGELLKPLLKDFGLRVQLGNHARRVVVDEFNADAVNARWEKIFMEALPARSRQVISRSLSQRHHMETRRLRVLFVNRPDALELPGGDTIQMLKTKEALEKRGLHVDVSLDLSPDASGYDLVHLFNTQIPSVQLAQLRSVRRYNVPVVLSSIFWDHVELLWARLALVACFREHAINLQQFLSGLSSRSLVINGRTPFSPHPDDESFLSHQREIVLGVDMVLPNSISEVLRIQQILEVENFPFRVVPNAIDPSIFLKGDPERFTQKYGRRDFILTVARWDDRKNILLLFLALKEVGLPLVMIGNRDAHGWYSGIALQHLPEDTLIIDHVAHEELADAYAAARVHVLPSWFETPGLSSMEAAVSGCSIVVGNRAAELEYFREVAYYCDPANVESIRQAVISAWNNYEKDRLLRSELKERILREYTWDRAAEETIAAYEEVLACRGSAQPMVQRFFEVPETHRKCEPSHDHVVDVSIVIPVYNNLCLTKTCLEKIRRNTFGVQYEIIVLDNASTDGTREFLLQEQQAGQLRAILNEANLGFAKACNMGAAEAKGRYILFLNNDTEPLEGWLRALVDAVEEDRVAAVAGAKLLYPNRTVQHAGVVFLSDDYYPITPVHVYQGFSRDTPQVNRKREVQAVTGACMLVRRDVFLDLGGFDEEFRNGYEDLDFCLRVREAGYRVIYVPEAEVVHHESKTPGRHGHEYENIVHFHRKWLGKLRSDLDAILRKDGYIPESKGTTAEASRPGCAVVVVTHNSLRGINACLYSLERTLAPNDHVIIVDNASTDCTREYLHMWAEGRQNVTLILNDENRGFAAAVKQGITASSKEFVVLLNPDVVVSRGWLERLLVYFEDPTVAAVGPLSDFVQSPQKFRLYLGPAHGMSNKATPTQISDLLHQRNRGRAIETNLLTGFCIVLRRQALEDAGGIDERLFFGNDDLDLSWRLRDCGFRLLIATDVFVHHLGQTSATDLPSEERNSLVLKSADTLMEKLVERYGWGNVPPPEELWGITWFAPSPQYSTAFRSPSPISSLTSIVIPVRNQFAHTRQCLQSIFSCTPEPFELIIVDNASSDGVEQYLQELADLHPRITLIRNSENLGFPIACNQGMSAARGDYILILNSDTIVTEGWLRRLLRCLSSEPDVGVVGPVSNNVSGLQVIPVSYESLEEMHRFARERAWMYYGCYRDTYRITGLCMLMRRDVVERIGGFDPRFTPGNYEDDDFCLRARIAGYRIKVALDVFIHHHGSMTFRGEGIDYGAVMKKNLSLFLSKWELPLHLDWERFYVDYAEGLARQPFDPRKHFVPLDTGVVAPAQDPTVLHSSRKEEEAKILRG